MCYLDCPNKALYHWDNSYTCYDNCPPGSFYENGYYTCYGSCEHTKYGYQFTVDGRNICYQKCSDSGLNFWKDGTKVCIDSCPTDMFQKKDEKICYANCTTTDQKYYISGSNLCYGNCTETGSFYNRKGEYECISDCGNMYHDDDSVICEESCSENKPYYVYNKHVCYKDCPNEALFHYETGNVCYAECPKYYAGGTHICYENCPDPGYPYNMEKTRKCVDKCPTGYKKEFKTCVSRCSADMFYIPEIDDCDTKCPDEKYIEDGGHICYDSCENTLSDWRYVVEEYHTCYESCEKTKAHKFRKAGSETCERKCPENIPYYIETNECYERCPVGYYKVPGKYSCELGTSQQFQFKAMQFSKITYNYMYGYARSFTSADLNMQSPMNVAGFIYASG